jgi:fucose permease
LPDTVVGVAWPSVRDHFGRQQSELALIFFGGGLSYFLSSFFTGRVRRYVGVGSLLAASSGLVALSGFGYGSASLWVLFVSCSILHGLGSGAIDASLNHYVASHFPARHVTWLHACYCVGAMLGPLIMTSIIAAHASWRAGYLTTASILLIMSLLFFGTRRAWNDPGTDSAETTHHATLAETLRHPLVWMQMALFFIYTGLEVTVGQWSFTVLSESRGVPVKTAGLFVTAYWASILAGRIAFGFVVEPLGPDRVVRISTWLTLVGSAIFFVWPALSLVALILTGLGLAAIFPCLMARTPQRLGPELAAHAIGFQVSAAMIGASALPSLAGYFGQRFGLETITCSAMGMAIGLLALHELLLRRSA